MKGLFLQFLMKSLSHRDLAGTVIAFGENGIDF